MGNLLDELLTIIETAANRIKYKIVEIKEENDTRQQELANGIAELEKDVCNELTQKGVGYFYFPTGFNDILSYIRDKNVTVMVCQYNYKKIIAASYITQGQGLYTYNDLTKYFKFNKEFIEYGKSKYVQKELHLIEYETYMKKIEGYKYAKELIAKELNITDLVKHCKEEKEKGTFDEKNEVREKVNKYIYDYFRDNINDRIGFIELDRFYLLKFSDLQKCENNEIKAKCEEATEENKRLYEEYDALLDLFDLNSAILSDNQNNGYMKAENFKTYFDANPFNTIELDTYIVHPDHRKKGLARIVSFEGLKIQIEKLLAKRPDLQEIFICGTIHQNNYPSKMVAQRLREPLQFLNYDTLFIKRRNGINREVYFCKIQKNNLEEVFNKYEEIIETLKKRLEADYAVVL